MNASADMRMGRLQDSPGPGRPDHCHVSSGNDTDGAAGLGAAPAGPRVSLGRGALICERLLQLLEHIGSVLRPTLTCTVTGIHYISPSTAAGCLLRCSLCEQGRISCSLLRAHDGADKIMGFCMPCQRIPPSATRSLSLLPICGLCRADLKDAWLVVVSKACMRLGLSSTSSTHMHHICTKFF